MKIIKKVISKRKGQANIWVQNDEYERIQLFFHANTLVPVRDTLHFGIKPGHFFVYTKKWNEEGKWLIKDAGYINYFRVDQTSVIQTEYNTLSKSKLLSRGILTHKFKDNMVELNSFSLFPIHHRKLILDMSLNSITIKDKFLWKSDIFFNTNNGLLTDTQRFSNQRQLVLS